MWLVSWCPLVHNIFSWGAELPLPTPCGSSKALRLSGDVIHQLSFSKMAAFCALIGLEILNPAWWLALRIQLCEWLSESSYVIGFQNPAMWLALRIWKKCLRKRAGKIIFNQGHPCHWKNYFYTSFWLRKKEKIISQVHRNFIIVTNNILCQVLIV